MIPTVGRIVYYKQNVNGEVRDYAAIVTWVWEDGTVSLRVFAPNDDFPVQTAAQGEEAGQWDWMPFQKEQAAKKEPVVVDEEAVFDQLKQEINAHFEKKTTKKKPVKEGE